MVPRLSLDNLATHGYSALMTKHKLFNAGPHAITFRGIVVVHDDGRMTWDDTDNDVQRWHNDYLEVL